MHARVPQSGGAWKTRLYRCLGEKPVRGGFRFCSVIVEFVAEMLQIRWAEGVAGCAVVRQTCALVSARCAVVRATVCSRIRNACAGSCHRAQSFAYGVQWCLTRAHRPLRRVRSCPRRVPWVVSPCALVPARRAVGPYTSAPGSNTLALGPCTFTLGPRAFALMCARTARA